jgi:hypothetical protein
MLGRTNNGELLFHDQATLHKKGSTGIYKETRKQRARLVDQSLQRIDTQLALVTNNHEIEEVLRCKRYELELQLLKFNSDDLTENATYCNQQAAIRIAGRLVEIDVELRTRHSVELLFERQRLESKLLSIGPPSQDVFSIPARQTPHNQHEFRISQKKKRRKRKKRKSAAPPPYKTRVNKKERTPISEPNLVPDSKHEIRAFTPDPPNTSSYPCSILSVAESNAIGRKAKASEEARQQAKVIEQQNVVQLSILISSMSLVLSDLKNNGLFYYHCQDDEDNVRCYIQERIDDDGDEAADASIRKHKHVHDKQYGQKLQLIITYTKKCASARTFLKTNCLKQAELSRLLETSTNRWELLKCEYEKNCLNLKDAEVSLRNKAVTKFRSDFECKQTKPKVKRQDSHSKTRKKLEDLFSFKIQANNLESMRNKRLSQISQDIQDARAPK